MILTTLLDNWLLLLAIGTGIVAMTERRKK